MSMYIASKLFKTLNNITLNLSLLQKKKKQIHYIGLSQFLKYKGAKAQLFGKNPDYFSLRCFVILM